MLSGYFKYDTTSPSCLVWNSGVTSEGRGSGERIEGSVAGSLTKTGYHIQVTNNGVRERSTAQRMVWEMHNGKVPKKHYIIHLDGDNTNCRIENLACVDHSTLQYWIAWRNNKANVALLPSGRWHATLKPLPTLGTYDTQEEAISVYRAKLKEVLISKNIPL